MSATLRRAAVAAAASAALVGLAPPAHAAPSNRNTVTEAYACQDAEALVATWVQQARTKNGFVDGAVTTQYGVAWDTTTTWWVGKRKAGSLHDAGSEVVHKGATANEIVCTFALDDSFTTTAEQWVVDVLQSPLVVLGTPVSVRVTGTVTLLISDPGKVG